MKKLLLVLLVLLLSGCGKPSDDDIYEFLKEDGWQCNLTSCKLEDYVYDRSEYAIFRTWETTFRRYHLEYSFTEESVFLYPQRSLDNCYFKMDLSERSYEDSGCEYINMMGINYRPKIEEDLEKSVILFDIADQLLEVAEIILDSA